MKLNLSVCLIFFSLLGCILSGQSRQLDFYFSNGKSARITENSLNYSVLTGPRSVFKIRAQAGTDDRLNFAQKSYNASVGFDFNLDGKLLSHLFQSGFDFLYDSSSLEQELSPYKNKTAFLGYAMRVQPIDSLSLSFGGQGIIRHEQDRYASDRIMPSEGFLANAALRGSMELLGTQLGVYGNIERKSLDWEAFRQTNINAWARYYGENFATQNSFNWDYREDDLFVLEPCLDPFRVGCYQKNDIQTRNGFGFGNFTEYYHPRDYFRLQFADIFSRRYISLKNNAARNNTDLLNQASLDFEAQVLPRLTLNSKATYNYSFKNFSYLGNTRHTELRALSAKLGWEYSEADSLILNSSIELQRSLYPEEKHKWDNDLLTRSISLGTINYWKSRIRLAAWASWVIKDDVYIDGILSANNKQVNRYTLQPDCSILIGDRLSFNQYYQLKAEYTNHVYEGRPHSLYRQLAYRYSLKFDSYPLIARSSNPVWLLLPYRPATGNAVLAEASFGYEQNDYADAVGEYYLIHNKNKRYSCSLALKHDIKTLYYILEPKYSWGTWKEYSMLFGLAWQFKEQSLLEVSINPTGEDLNNLDWRSSVNLGFRF